MSLEEDESVNSAKQVSIDPRGRKSKSKETYHQLPRKRGLREMELQTRLLQLLHDRVSRDHVDAMSRAEREKKADGMT